MTTRDDIERKVYAALTGGRYGLRSETPATAMAQMARIAEQRGVRPHEVAPGMFSRETWRRWNLPEGAKNAQRPSKAHAAALTRWLRGRRVPPGRQDRIRLNHVTVDLKSNYETDLRQLGPQTLGWSAGANSRILAAFLRGGTGAQVFLAAIREDHFRTWLDPQRDGTTESYDLLSIDLTSSPTRGSSTRRR